MVDTQIDINHPEIRGSNIATKGGAALKDLHGTATATVAAAPQNGVGMLGIWPDARVLNVPLPTASGSPAPTRCAGSRARSTRTRP